MGRIKHLTLQAANITVEAAKAKQSIDQQGVKPTGYERFAQADETNVGGVFTAGNNTTLITNGDKTKGQGNLALTGATIAAQDGQASLIASNNVTIQNDTTQHSSATESYASKQTSSGFSVSLCISPLCERRSGRRQHQQRQANH